MLVKDYKVFKLNAISNSTIFKYLLGQEHSCRLVCLVSDFFVLFLFLFLKTVIRKINFDDVNNSAEQFIRSFSIKIVISDPPVLWGAHQKLRNFENFEKANKKKIDNVYIVNLVYFNFINTILLWNLVKNFFWLHFRLKILFESVWPFEWHTS